MEDDQDPCTPSLISLKYTDVTLLEENDIDGRVVSAGTIKFFGT